MTTTLTDTQASTLVVNVILIAVCAFLAGFARGSWREQKLRDKLDRIREGESADAQK